MGQELEYKLAVPSRILLERILSDGQVAQMRREEYRRLSMETIYYDTPDRRLRMLRWTLRMRRENGAPVATLKTPGQGRARGEWACAASSIHEAIPALLEQGAPQELAGILENQPLAPVCTARFTRRAADLAFSDGTVCELSGDVGLLAGGGKEAPLCELELELKKGSEETVAAFAQTLMARFGLKEEPMSKFARAAALAAEGGRP